jgi:beta-lactamase regulating signal transducer with metallopeptidase domain
MTSDLIRLAAAQTWQLAVLVACVLLVTRVIARDRPHLAYALWLVVLFKCVTPPLWSSPSGVFCWLQASPAAASAAEEPVAAISHFADLSAASPHDVVVHWTPATPLQTLPAKDSAHPLALTWSEGLVGVWLTGAVCSLMISAIRWQLFLRRLRRYPLHTDADLNARAAQLARRLKVRRRVRLLITDSRIGPAVIGILRPTILLPAAIVAGKSPADLEPILAHELLHVRRGDLWLAAGQVLAQSLWWFHPLVWLANRLLTREAERCCDEQVVAELRCEPARYARSLLEILEQKHALVAVPAFPGVRPVDITSSRLERIMRLGHGCQRRTPWWCWLVMLLAAALVLPGAAFVAGAKERPAKQKKPAQQPPPVGAQARAAGDSAKTVSRVYLVRDVLQRLADELKISESEARVTLVNQLICTIGNLQLQAHRTGTLANPDAGVSGDIELTDNTPFAWSGRKLVVTHRAAVHDRLAAELDRLREFGLRQVTIKVRMISGPRELIERFPVKWSASSPQFGQGLPAATGPQPQAAPPLIPPPAAGEGQSWTRATSIVEKNMPVLYAVIDPPQANALIETVQVHPRANILQAPKVTVFNGQAATVMEAVQRPFVVGVQPVAGSNPPAHEPQIRVVTEGTTLRMRPVLKDAGELHLDYELLLSSIRGVEEAEIPQGPGVKPLVVQVPVVASLRFNTSLDLPLGKTLAVGWYTKDKDVSAATLVLLEVSEAVDSGERESVAPPAAGPGRTAPVANLVARAAYLQGERQRSPPAPWKHASTEELLDREIFATHGRLALDEAVACIGKAAGINIWIDPRGLAAEGVKLDMPVIVQRQRGSVAARTLLKQLLEPLGLEFRIEGEVVRVTGESESRKTYTKVYHVADLIVAVPTIVAIGEGKRFAPPPVKDAKADFEPLIELIQTTIAPHSWDETGGPGSISAFDTNLSLVVSQTQDVHEQIADLLTQLRRLQDQQIVLELRLLNVPENFFERVGIDFDLQTAVEGDIYPAHARLSSQQTKALLKAVSAKLSHPTRVTLLNGQGADLDLPLGERTVNLKVVPLIRADRDSVRLNLAIEEEDAALAMQSSQSPNCQTNQTFLLDVTDRVPATGVPILTKIPHVERLFRQVPPAGSRVLLLVTPTIHITEEVEAR